MDSKRIIFCGLVLLFAFTAMVNAQDVCKAEYGLVIDNSSGFRRLLERVMNGATTVVQAQKPGDRGFVLTFVGYDNIKLKEDFTEDTEELIDAVESMYIEGGSTAIYDGLAKAIINFNESGSKETDVCRSIILVSDGDDRGSISKPDQVIASSKQNKIKIFVVGMSDGKMNNKPLEKLAKETGGEMFLARTPLESKAAFESVIERMRLK